MMHPYFKNPLVSLYYNREEGIGMAVWQGHVQGPDFREAILLCLELMSRYELRGWLSDNRKVKSINIDDLQWSLKVINIRTAAISLLRLARIPSEEEDIRSIVETMLDGELEFASKGQLCHFEEVQEAMHWLTKPI